MTSSSQEITINNRGIITNVFHLFSGLVISQGFTIVTFFLTARQLGPEKYGAYSATLILASFTSILFSLGLNTWLLREASRSPVDIGSLFGSVLSIKLGVGIIWFVGMIVLAFMIDSPSFPREIFILNALVVWVDNLFATLFIPLKATLRNKFPSLMMILADGLWFFVTLLLISQNIIETRTFVSSRLIVMIINLTIAAVIVLNWYKPKMNLNFIRRAFKEMFPYSISELLTTSSKQIDVLIVASSLGGKSTGLYSPAVSLVNALFLPINAASGVFLPVLSNLFQHNAVKAWEFGKRSIISQFFLGLILSLGLGFGAKYLIGFLGVRYYGTLEILEILSIVLVIHAVTASITNILIADNLQSKRALIQAATVVINIALNLLIIPRVGITGAAWVYVTTEIIALAGSVYFLPRNFLIRKP